MLMTPEEPVELVGRHDMSWTVSFKDDSMSLAVYLRTKPAKSWTIATAVRLKMSPEIQIPIGPKDAAQVCFRLQNYLRWLEQNRQYGEAMRSNKKTSAMAKAGLAEIEKQVKATERSLKNWILVDDLVRAFYSSNALELELASSREKLP